MIHPGTPELTGKPEPFKNYKQALHYLTGDPIIPLYIYGETLQIAPNSVPRETLTEVIKSAQIRMKDRLMFLLGSGDLPEHDGVGKQQIEEVYELTKNGDWVQDLDIFEQFLERTSNLMYGEYKRPDWLEYLISEPTPKQ